MGFAQQDLRGLDDREYMVAGDTAFVSDTDVDIGELFLCEMFQLLPVQGIDRRKLISYDRELRRAVEPIDSG